jgi:hypothetical protein
MSKKTALPVFKKDAMTIKNKQDYMGACLHSLAFVLNEDK